ncbi:MAG: transcriptional regulator [Citrobacter freundii]|nr:MAG: transcriptional regulator [Citrobacter freundii]
MKAKKNNKHVPLDPNLQLEKLGKRLRELRLKKGYSSLEIFAYEHGFGRAQYGRYELGQDLQFTTLVRLVNCFEMSLEEFFNDGFN